MSLLKPDRRSRRRRKSDRKVHQDHPCHSPGCMRLPLRHTHVPVWQWTPARLPAFDVVALASITVVMAVIRSLDYVTGNDKSSALSLIERTFPLQVWAALIGVGAALLGLGMLLRVHVAVFLGHGILGTLYMALAYGVAVQAFHQPAADGIRSAGVLLLPVALHGLLFLRMGPRPWGWASATE